MNDIHWHLVVNHLPLIFPIVGIITLLCGILTRSEAVKRMALFIFILGALTTLLAMNSGEEAEELAENLIGVSHDLIHEHEENAETFALMSYLLGALSLVGFLGNYRKKKWSDALVWVVLIFAGVLLYFSRATATTGGEIRHPEIRGEKVDPSLLNDHEEHDEHEEH